MKVVWKEDVVYWENRAMKAEAEIERLRAENAELKRALDWIEKGIDPSGLADKGE